MIKRKRKVGLALGSGGARGWAHIGVINALYEADVAIQYVAGTSMGSLVGAACASDRVRDLQNVAEQLDWRQVLSMMSDISLPKAGLIDGRHVVEFVRDHVLPGNIEDLPIPYAAVATDIQTGEEIVLREGSITDAVRASIAIPGLFTPFTNGVRVLVDGGLVNPLPINVVRDMGADYVIAVDITRSPLPARPSVAGVARSRRDNLLESTQQFLEKLNVRLPALDRDMFPSLFRSASGQEQPGLMEIYGNMMRIFQRQVTMMRLQLSPPDLLIQPDVQDISTMEFHRADDAIEAGYKAARAALAQ